MDVQLDFDLEGHFRVISRSKGMKIGIFGIPWEFPAKISTLSVSMLNHSSIAYLKEGGVGGCQAVFLPLRSFTGSFQCQTG